VRLPSPVFWAELDGRTADRGPVSALISSEPGSLDCVRCPSYEFAAPFASACLFTVGQIRSVPKVSKRTVVSYANRLPLPLRPTSVVLDLATPLGRLGPFGNFRKNQLNFAPNIETRFSFLHSKQIFKMLTDKIFLKMYFGHSENLKLKEGGWSPIAHLPKKFSLFSSYKFAKSVDQFNRKPALI